VCELLCSGTLKLLCPVICTVAQLTYCMALIWGAIVFDVDCVVRTACSLVCTLDAAIHSHKANPDLPLRPVSVLAHTELSPPTFNSLALSCPATCRDVTLGNILVRPRADVTPDKAADVSSCDAHELDIVLADFGAAFITSSAKVVPSTVIGTPGYIAPEVYCGGLSSTGAYSGSDADVFSVVVCYMVLR